MQLYNFVAVSGTILFCLSVFFSYVNDFVVHMWSYLTICELLYLQHLVTSLFWTFYKMQSE